MQEEKHTPQSGRCERLTRFVERDAMLQIVFDVVECIFERALAKARRVQRIHHNPERFVLEIPRMSMADGIIFDLAPAHRNIWKL